MTRELQKGNALGPRAHEISRQNASICARNPPRAAIACAAAQHAAALRPRSSAAPDDNNWGNDGAEWAGSTPRAQKCCGCRLDPPNLLCTHRRRRCKSGRCIGRRCCTAAPAVQSIRATATTMSPLLPQMKPHLHSQHHHRPSQQLLLYAGQERAAPPRPPPNQCGEMSQFSTAARTLCQ